MYIFFTDTCKACVRDNVANVGRSFYKYFSANIHESRSQLLK